MVEKAKLESERTKLTEAYLSEHEKKKKQQAEQLLFKSDGWKEQRPNGKTQIFTQAGISKSPIILCKGIINCSITEAYNLIELDEEAAKQVDKDCPAEIIDKLYNKYYLVYLQFLNLGPLVSNRYTFFISYDDLKYKENEYLIWGSSLDHPLDFSSYQIDTKKAIRAKIPIFAWHLKAINEKSTEVMYISEINFEGSLPQGLITQELIQNQGETIQKYNKYLEKKNN